MNESIARPEVHAESDARDKDGRCYHRPGHARQARYALHHRRKCNLVYTNAEKLLLSIYFLHCNPPPPF